MQCFEPPNGLILSMVLIIIAVPQYAKTLCRGGQNVLSSKAGRGHITSLTLLTLCHLFQVVGTFSEKSDKNARYLCVESIFRPKSYLDTPLHN